MEIDTHTKLRTGDKISSLLGRIPRIVTYNTKKKVSELSLRFILQNNLHCPILKDAVTIIAFWILRHRYRM